MAHSAAKKQRCLSAIQARIKKHGPTKAMRLVSDLENISYKTLNAWYYRAEAEPEKTESRYGRSYPTAGSEVAGTGEKVESSTAHLGLEPVAPPAPPVQPYVESDGGQLRCSRCSSTKHLRQLEAHRFYCDVCRVSLPYEPVEDMELKTVPSPHRALHWMM